MSAHDTKSQPNHGTDDGNDKGVDPQRPGEVPDQEVESDPFRVLDDENDEEPDSDERCDRAATESGSARLTATLTLLCHGESPSREVAFTRWMNCSISSCEHVTCHIFLLTSTSYETPNRASIPSGKRGQRRDGGFLGSSRGFTLAPRTVRIAPPGGFRGARVIPAIN